MDVFGAEAAVEAAIAVIHEDGVFDRLHHTRLLGGSGEAIVMGLHFIAEQQPFLILLLAGFFLQLLLARLDGEVGLAQCDERLGWIGILNDKVTGVAGKQPVLDGTAGS